MAGRLSPSVSREYNAMKSGIPYVHVKGGGTENTTDRSSNLVSERQPSKLSCAKKTTELQLSAAFPRVFFAVSFVFFSTERVEIYFGCVAVGTEGERRN